MTGVPILTCIYIFVGCGFYLNGRYVAKNPYSQIKGRPKLKKVATPVTIDKYGRVISEILTLTGILIILSTLLFSFLKWEEAVFLFPFSVITFAIVCMRYAEKIITGKVPLTSIILILLLMGGGLITTVFSLTEPSVNLDENHFEISGIYGENISFQEVKKIRLDDSLPVINLRTNGISIGQINKGYFYSKSLGKNVKLLIHSSSPPFIYIEKHNKTIILNFREDKKTINLYNQLNKDTKNE